MRLAGAHALTTALSPLPQAAEALLGATLARWDAELDGEVGGAALCAEEVLGRARGGDSAHYAAFRDALHASLRFGDHEAVDHPVACAWRGAQGRALCGLGAHAPPLHRLAGAGKQPGGRPRACLYGAVQGGQHALLPARRRVPFCAPVPFLAVCAEPPFSPSPPPKATRIRCCCGTTSSCTTPRIRCGWRRRCRRR